MQVKIVEFLDTVSLWEFSSNFLETRDSFQALGTWEETEMLSNEINDRGRYNYYCYSKVGNAENHEARAISDILCDIWVSQAIAKDI